MKSDEWDQNYELNRYAHPTLIAKEKYSRFQDKEWRPEPKVNNGWGLKAETNGSWAWENQKPK